jgi:short-subunit dehydrogenase
MKDKVRTALITGASAGLGKEFARQLAERGYNLVLVARNPATLQEVAAQISLEFGVEAAAICADLSQPNAPRDIAAQLSARNLQIDYLVNNAGSAGPSLLDDNDWQKQTEFFQLMMLSIAHLCHLLVPPMCERGFGRVINVASVAGRVASGGGCNYGPSKAWVIALSEELALTVADEGVKVCALCPGFTHTEFHQRAGLMDMKNSIANWLWYPAEVVVRDGLKAVERGKRIFVSGRIYRLVDPFMQSVLTRRFFTRNDGRREQSQSQL